MKNRLGDLNNHLFAQMERLSVEDLSAEQLEREVRRARAIVGVSGTGHSAFPHAGFTPPRRPSEPWRHNPSEATGGAEISGRKKPS